MKQTTHALGRIGVVFAKEVKDNLRDRRSIVSALMSTLVGPVILVLMIIIVGKSLFSESTEKQVELPVRGAEYAPTLVQFLEQNGVRVVAAPAKPEAAVRAGDVDVVIIVSPEFAEDFSAGQPASIRLVFDSSRQSAMISFQRAANLLQGYSRQIGTLRLMARGIHPNVTNPLLVEQTDLATPQTQALLFLNMMPYFIVLVVFVGGMYVIIDTTAGERERGSLEPLLINPVPRWELVMGKLLASLPFAVVTVIITLVAFAAAFNLVPLEDYVGFQLTIDLGALVMIFFISLPMVVLASAMQMIVATFTRSFKEAQTYVAFLPMIPALPGIGLAFLPVKPTLTNMLIPTFGQQLLINQAMRGEAVSLENVLISSAVTLLASAVLIWIAIKLYERDRIIFGTK